MSECVCVIDVYRGRYVRSGPCPFHRGRYYHPATEAAPYYTSATPVSMAGLSATPVEETPDE